MKNYIVLFVAAVALTSCVDTVILPNNRTVKEDFWKTKSDVALMVNGAYASMQSSSLITNLFVWGDFRSDELVSDNGVESSNSTRIDLTQIETGNIETTNTFSNWASLYSVINNCNLVLSNAEGVLSIDPSYTEGDYRADRAQMLTLRALCYFYLVRTFRDIPYSDVAYENSSQNMNLPQTAPDVVLQKCINDLETAEKDIFDASAYSGWRGKGWINRDAVRTLLADIYLWRASVLHSAADYQKCIDYCNLVIESKKNNHIVTPGEVETSEYPLAKGEEAFNKLFVDQNSEESIFELQFDGSKGSNTGLCQSFYKYGSNSSSNGFMKASTIFGKAQASVNYAYQKSSDFRFIENCYGVLSSGSIESESYAVRKFVEVMQTNTGNPTGHAPYTSARTRSYDNFKQNYLVYRLTDVMLMKAEAMTQLYNDGESGLRQAFNIVQAVNSRSLYSANLSSDSLKWNSYNTKEAMESLVLEERLRELCFEGKRWYDLVRYNYRHVDGVDYSSTLAEQNAQGKALVENFSEMLQLMARKNPSSSTALIAKMPTEPYLYMPIFESELKVNANLRQNPVYSASNEFEKQY